MILTLNPLTSSLALAGAGRVIPPLERIHGLIDSGAHTSSNIDAAELISRFHMAFKTAKIQDLYDQARYLDNWGKEARKGNGDANQWLINVNIFFQDLQSPDADDAIEQLAGIPAALQILF